MEYIVGEMLAGRGDQIKGYNIAVEVLGRSEEFNGGVDPIVRVEGSATTGPAAGILRG